MKQLNEKVAIVTGAGQGIGKGIALCLAKRGVKVIATGRRLEPIEQTIAEIKELGGEGFAMSCDSADRARVDEVVKAAVEKYGTIDVVVNNAQAIVPSSPVEETSYDNMLKAWQSGVIGSLNYMQAAFPYMKEQHEGRIIKTLRLYKNNLKLSGGVNIYDLVLLKVRGRRFSENRGFGRI